MFFLKVNFLIKKFILLLIHSQHQCLLFLIVRLKHNF